MSVLAIILPLALLVVGAAVAAWVWAARSGQYDDTDTPAARVLVDDATPGPRDAPPTQAVRRASGVGAGDSRK